MALTQMNVKWRHQGRAWNRSLDCLGLVTVTGIKCGLLVDDVVNYATQPDTERLLSECRRQMTELDLDDVRKSSVMLFHFGDWTRPYHFAFDSGDGLMLHGSAKSKKVVLQSYDEYWQEKLCYRFDIPGVTD